MSEPQQSPPSSMEEADARNGEPDALKKEQAHPTGERQAEKNREEEPPA